MNEWINAPKIYEPDEDRVHYVGPDGLDQVTLCGVPDWLGRERTKGVTTDRPLNCFSCQRIVEFVLMNVGDD